MVKIPVVALVLVVYYLLTKSAKYREYEDKSPHTSIFEQTPNEVETPFDIPTQPTTITRYICSFHTAFLNLTRFAHHKADKISNYYQLI